MHHIPQNRQSRLSKLSNLHKRIQKPPILQISSPSSPSSFPYKFQPSSKTSSFNQLIITMLWVDKQLQNRINIFPLQLQELENALPNKNLRPLLKMLNTIMSNGQKQIKCDDIQWKQQAIYMLELSQRQWSKRWEIEEYNEIVYKGEKGNNGAMSQIILKVQDQWGIDCNSNSNRGLVLRYLMDIKN